MADKVSKFIFPVKSGNTIANKEFELPRGSSFDGDYNSLTNKPTLGTAAAKDVPSSGNASSSQVVMGNDSRLSDSRNAKDVPAWAKASSKPTYTASEVGAIATSAKGVANGVAELDSTGKVPSSQLPSQVSNSGDAYDSTKSYAVGDLCIYNNVLYRCTTACSAGSWATNRSCFTADTLVNIVSSNSNFMLITDQTLSDPKAVIESHWDEIPTTNHQQLICIVTSVYTYYAIVGKYNPHYSAVKLYGYGEDDTSYKIVVGQRFNDVWKWRSLKFGSRERVTALQSNNGTWVATEDGFIYVTTDQPASGVVYIYLYEGDSVIGSIALQNGTGGLTHAFTVPVQKKRKYKILFGGVSSIGVDFRPLYS